MKRHDRATCPPCRLPSWALLADSLPTSPDTAKAHKTVGWGNQNDVALASESFALHRPLLRPYGWRVPVNRPFGDGNKRMALALVTDLKMNDLMWKCGEVDVTTMVLRPAAGET